MQLALLALKNQYTKDVKGIKFSKNAKMSDVINNNLCNISSFFFLVIPLINSSHLIPKLDKISLKLSKCCEAKIAVGAIVAA